MIRRSAVRSGSARARLDVVSDFLRALPASQEVVLVAASRGAADDCARAVALARGVSFGVHRFSVTQIAARLAMSDLAAGGPRADHRARLRGAGDAGDVRRRAGRRARVSAAGPRHARISARAGGDVDRAALAGRRTPQQLAAPAAERRRPRRFARADRRAARRRERHRSRRAVRGGDRAAGAARPRCDRRHARFRRRAGRAARRAVRLGGDVGVSAEARRAGAAGAGDDSRGRRRGGAALIGAGFAIEDRDDPRETDLTRLHQYLFAEQPPPRARLERASWCGCRRRAKRANASRSRGASSRRPPPASASTRWPSCCDRRSSMPAFSSTPSIAPGLPRTSIAARIAPILPAARFSRSSRVPSENLSATRFAEYLSLAQVPTDDVAAPDDAWVIPDDEGLGLVAPDDGAAGLQTGRLEQATPR